MPQALTKRPESRPSAAQLFQHPWVRQHYQALAAEHQHPVAVAGAAAAGAAFTPELRRTVSQPPSPSKSMPDGAAAAAGRVAGAGAVTPAAVASALAPFLPLSQAKMAHKVGGEALGWRLNERERLLVTSCTGNNATRRQVVCSLAATGPAAVPWAPAKQRQGAGSQEAAGVRPLGPRASSARRGGRSGRRGGRSSSSRSGGTSSLWGCATRHAAPGSSPCSSQRGSGSSGGGVGLARRRQQRRGL